MFHSYNATVIVAVIGTLSSPVVGGVVAALAYRRMERYEYRWLVAAGVGVGIGISAMCFQVAGILIMNM